MKRLWALLLGAMLLTAPVLGDQAEAQGPPDVVKVGYIGVLSDAGIFVAMEKGYFDEQNIKLELQRFPSGTDQVALLANETLDIGTGALGPGLFNAIAQGVPIRMVADKGSLPEGFGFNVFVVRQDLIDSGRVKTTADLKGLTFGVEAMTAGTLVEHDAILKSGGLTLDDVRFTLVNIPDMPAALANKAVDALITVEPFGTVIESQGTGKIFLTVDELLPDFQIAAVYYSQGFSEGRRDVALRWMVAYLKGVRFYNEAFQDPAKKEELIQILMKHTAVQDPMLYERMIWPGLHPQGRINADSVMHQQEFWRERRQVPNPVPLERIIDNSFVEAALEMIGS